MAKRASKDDFNMAAEIRALLSGNPKLKGKQVIEALQKKFPKQVINKNSASVAFANARKAMGIRGPRKVTRRRRPVGSSTVRATSTAHSAAEINLEMLQAAKNLLQKCNGDATIAASALRNVASLQMS